MPMPDAPEAKRKSLIANGQRIGNQLRIASNSTPRNSRSLKIEFLIESTSVGCHGGKAEVTWVGHGPLVLALYSREQSSKIDLAKIGRITIHFEPTSVSRFCNVQLATRRDSKDT